MKKLACSILCVMLILVLTGCKALEINGISNFRENDCHFGLTDNLLPNDRTFLTDYPYEEGDYHYWQNNWLSSYAQVKVFVQLMYSEEVYQQAKLACTEQFTISEEKYPHKDLTFHIYNPTGENLSLDDDYPGVRLFGYNDDLCTLVFIAYMDDNPKHEQLNASNLSDILDDQFGAWLK